MPTKGPSEQQEEERNIELENTVGNLMVAEYQVDRLRNRLSDNIREMVLVLKQVLEVAKRDLHMYSSTIINGIRFQ